MDFFFLLFSFPLSDRHISGRVLLYVCLVNFFVLVLCLRKKKREKKTVFVFEKQVFKGVTII